MRFKLRSSFCTWMPVAPAPFVEKVIFPLWNCLLIFLQISWAYISLPKAQCIDYCSCLVVDFNYQIKLFFSFYSYFKITRAILEPITFHINFRIVYLYKNLCQDFCRHCIKPIDRSKFALKILTLLLNITYIQIYKNVEHNELLQRKCSNVNNTQSRNREYYKSLILCSSQ